VTGWAQVCGGKLIAVEEKNALDEWYIRHASLQLDIAILLRTLGALFTGDCRDEKAISAAVLERAQNEPVAANRADADRNVSATDFIESIESISP
jgi:hypothetical protein